MPRSRSEIAAEFNALANADFEGDKHAHGFGRLAELCDEVRSTNDPTFWIPFLFQSMERLAEADIGSPGPFVHTLESWQGQYGPTLFEFVSRNPTSHGLWMVNRILNSCPSDAAEWLDLLHRVADDPNTSTRIKEEATEYIRRQTGA